MPILRDDDPRVGWLAVPVTALAGLVLFSLGAASVGAGAGVSSVAGVVGLVVGAFLASAILWRQRRNR